MSAIYPNYPILCQTGLIDLVNRDVYVVGVDSSYVYSSSHQYLSDIIGVVTSPSLLTSKTLVNGAFDAGDTTLTKTSNNAITSLILYTTDLFGRNALICILDSFSVSPPGAGTSPVNLVWPNTSNRIFKLA